MTKILQNFFKTTVSIAWGTGTGNLYLATKPTSNTAGWLVVSPNSASLREIVAYSGTGTDGSGDYIVCTARGVGGTTAQVHAVAEPVRMNITAEHWADIFASPTFTGTVTVPTPTNSTDAASKGYADALAIAGSPDATTSTKGIVKMSVAPVSATSPIAVGDNDTRMLTADEKAAAAGTSGTPSSTNKFVTDADTTGTGAILRTSAAPAVTEVQTYTASTTWTKPTGAIKVLVQAWGGGGGGGSQSAAIGAQGGGGGGAYKERWFLASDLAATVEATVGAGGSGATGGTNNATAGGNSYFSTGAGGTGTVYLTSYGGGFAYSAGAGESGGAGGGGAKAAGANSNSTTGGVGGGPGLTPSSGSAEHTSNSGFGGGGGGTSGANAAAGDSAMGGGGGGAGSLAYNGGAGGYSIYGGGGGGGSSRDGVAVPGGTSEFGGAGGAGTKGGAGIAGSVPGGGGGGSGASGTTGPYNGGNGGAGKVIVTTFF